MTQYVRSVNGGAGEGKSHRLAQKVQNGQPGFIFHTHCNKLYVSFVYKYSFCKKKNNNNNDNNNNNNIMPDHIVKQGRVAKMMSTTDNLTTLYIQLGRQFLYLKTQQSCLVRSLS